MKALQRRRASANGIAARQDVDVRRLHSRVVVFFITTTTTGSTFTKILRHVVLPRLRGVERIDSRLMKTLSR